MASGSQTLTTYYAKRIMGDTAAANADSALLQTGTNIATNTWILSRTNRSNEYGIKYVYDSTTDGEDDKLELYGNYKVSDVNTPTAWVNLHTGEIGVVGHIYLTGTAATTGSTTTQIVFTNSNASSQYASISCNTGGALVINPSSSSTTGQIILHPGSISAFTSGTLTINDSEQSTYKFKVTGTSYFNGNTIHYGTIHVWPQAGGYCEGIRIHSYNSWSHVTLCGNDNTGNAGTSANTWGLFNNNGTLYLTKYGSNSSDNAIMSNVDNIWKFKSVVQGHKSGINKSVIHIYGATYGNTATDMASGTAGLFSWNDGGPQITFSPVATISSSDQAGALIFTDNDTAATGVSWHFVSNQTDWNVTSKRFHARTSISIGTNLPSTTYNLSVTGTSYLNGAVTFANNTMNNMGDDCQIGDQNSAGAICIKGLNGNTNIRFIQYNNTAAGTITWDGKQFICSHPITRAGVAKSWYNGRDSAIIKTTSYSGYDAILSMKTTAGDWALGVYNNNIMYFTYILDSHYNANSNTITKQFIFNPDGTLTATTFSGNLTGNVTGDVTGNCSGSSGSCTGNAATATKWQTKRSLTIGATGKDVDGSAAVSWSVNEILGSSTNANFYRGDKTWTNTLNGAFTANGTITANGGYIKSTANSNTVTIGSQNASFCHIYNSASIPFIFNNSIQTTKGALIGSTGQYRPYQLYLGYNTTANSRALDSGNPLIEFANSSRSQYAQIVYTDYDSQGGSDSFTFVSNQSDLRVYAPKVHGAVWNDYAECRQATITIPGMVVTETSSGTMKLSTERLMPACRVISDTYGMIIGETETAQTPIAVSGRVLVYTYKNRNEYPLGAAVCSAPNGTIDIMTRDEIIMYPERIIGTVSEIPEYDTWQAGYEGKISIPVNGRIWIYVR